MDRIRLDVVIAAPSVGLPKYQPGGFSPGHGTGCRILCSTHVASQRRRGTNPGAWLRPRDTKSVAGAAALQRREAWLVVQASRGIRGSVGVGSGATHCPGV